MPRPLAGPGGEAILAVKQAHITRTWPLLRFFHGELDPLSFAK
jgi:hypothetical protein